MTINISQKVLLVYAILETHSEGWSWVGRDEAPAQHDAATATVHGRRSDEFKASGNRSPMASKSL